MANLDTLAFTKRLRDAGVPSNHAEAHAEAARDYAMKDLATKADIDAAIDRVTIRLGGIVVMTAGALFAALKLFH